MSLRSLFTPAGPTPGRPHTPSLAQVAKALRRSSAELFPHARTAQERACLTHAINNANLLTHDDDPSGLLAWNVTAQAITRRLLEATSANAFPKER